MSIRKINTMTTYIFGLILVSSVSIGCQDSSIHTINQINNNESRTVNQKAKDYWYDGTAEITSYKLTQARYGEMHEGNAVLVYVTEPFSKSSFTKSDHQTKLDIPVLKLNTTKNFNTGIYPYSMMNSTFFPFEGESASLKIATSVQEWCGMTYREMKNEKNKYIFKYDSYFEGQTFDNKKLNKSILEDDLWSVIRLNPELLPVGNLKMIPAMFYLSLKHKVLMDYDVIAKISKGAKITEYSLEYPTLERTVVISFETAFPNRILSWEESYNDAGNMLTTTATQINSIKTAYWSKNKNIDTALRKKLGLQ